MFGLGMTEMIIIGVIAVILFGQRLPDVAKQLGGSYREFKKGLGEFSSQMTTDYDSSSSYSAPPAPSYDYEDHEEATAPKFEPPPSEPTESANDESA